MAAISGRFVIFSRESNVLLDSPAMLETEAKIICAVRVALECNSLIIEHHKGEIRLNSNFPFKTDSKTVLCVRIVQLSGQTIVFRGADEVLATPFAIFETASKVI
jgi:hypothetical protein